MPLIGNLGSIFRCLPVSDNKSRLGRLLTALAPPQLDSIAEVVMKDGSRLLLDARSRLESSAFWNGIYEPDELSFLKECLSPDDLIIDVGASVGLITIPLGRHLKSLGGGKLLAFEPVKTNFDRLLKSVELNQLDDTVQCMNCALGAEAGQIRIAMEKGGASGNAVDARALGNLSRFVVTNVEVATLDSIFHSGKLDRLSLIKLDLEGSEMAFLLGARECLSTLRPIILGEFHNKLMPRLGHNFLDVVELIRPWNYRIFAFAKGRQLVEIKEPEPNRGNVVLIPDENACRIVEKVNH